MPISAIGIHQLGESTRAGFYSRVNLGWLQETTAQQPWRDWRVGPAGTGSVAWRDVIILDDEGKFCAVQNLSDDALNDPTNFSRLKNNLRNAATHKDVDSDGLPDAWERANLGGINVSPMALGSAGRPHLQSYAFGLTPSQSSTSMEPQISLKMINGARTFEMVFRRRLGLSGTELLNYAPEMSSGLNGGWTSTGWTMTGRENPFDGTGTEVLTVRATATQPTRQFARLKIVKPD